MQKLNYLNKLTKVKREKAKVSDMITKSTLDKTDYESLSLRERLKDAEAKLTKGDDKVKSEKDKVSDKITKSTLDKTDYESLSLRERLKDAETKLSKRDDKS